MPRKKKEKIIKKLEKKFDYDKTPDVEPVKEKNKLVFSGRIYSKGKTSFDLEFNGKIILINSETTFEKGDKVKVILEGDE